MLASNDRLYVCTNCFEFGGEVYEVNGRTGDCQKIYRGGTITDILVDKKGTIWFSEGFENWADGESAQLVSWDGRLTEHGYVQNADAKTWPFGSTTFKGISLMPNGKILVVTKDFGLFSYDGKNFKQLTPNWPGRLRVCDMESIGKYAVVSIYHTGLIDRFRFV